MSVHWAIMRRELPYNLRCCEDYANEHRKFAIELEDSCQRLLLVTTKYSRRRATCIWCGTKDNCIGIKIVDPPSAIREFIGPTGEHYIGVDVVEIDEGEYDATKPPPSTKEV